MTTVEFLSNPTPDESVYMWRATGVDQLTRENKLSSLPFWAPNNITKKHQFRLTMLKGLTPNKDAENDSYAILLDLIPPPPSPDHQGGDTLYPGGCSVKLTVINSVDPAKSVVEESAEFLSASRLQISFPDIISKHTAKNPAFATDNLSTLTVQVHIHTGVNVAAAQVSKTVSSLWGTLTSTVSQLIEKTSEAYQETRRELEQELAKKQAPAVPSSGPLPWDVVPPKWAEKAEQWRTLVSSNIVEDDGTFLYGPERGWTPDENSMMLSVGLNPHSLSDLFDKFDYDRDIHEGLVENKVLAHQRYLIVPSKISDQKFWENYFWKVACLGECTSEPQVKTLLTVLNGPPHQKPRELQAGKVSEESILSLAQDAQEAADLLLEYLNEQFKHEDTFLVEAAVSTCEEHVRMLEPIFCRKDVSESTQLLVGAVLRRLRERLQKYNEFQRSNPSLVSSPNREASVEPVVESHDHTPAVAKKKEEAETPVAAVASVESTPAPQAPVSTPPKETPKASSVTTDGDRSTSKAAIEFPKMPWEEDDI